MEMFPSSNYFQDGKLSGVGNSGGKHQMCPWKGVAKHAFMEEE